MFKGFREYQPSKTQAFWFGIACIVATMVVGFTWGGWVTGATAEQMADEAAEKSRVQLGAAVCVEQFKRAANSDARLEELKETNPYSRDEMVRAAGWATMPGEDSPDREVADACAERLAALERVPPDKEVAQTTAAEQEASDTTVQQ